MWLAPMAKALAPMRAHLASLFSVNEFLVLSFPCAAMEFGCWCGDRCWARPLLYCVQAGWTQLKSLFFQQYIKRIKHTKEKYKSFCYFRILWKRFFFHEMDRIYKTIKNGADNISINQFILMNLLTILHQSVPIH